MADEPKIFHAQGALGRLTMKFCGEKYKGLDILDTKVEVGGKVLCFVTWKDKDKFTRELNDVINKYQI